MSIELLPDSSEAQAKMQAHYGKKKTSQLKRVLRSMREYVENPTKTDVQVEIYTRNMSAIETVLASRGENVDRL